MAQAMCLGLASLILCLLLSEEIIVIFLLKTRKEDEIIHMYSLYRLSSVIDSFIYINICVCMCVCICVRTSYIVKKFRMKCDTRPIDGKRKKKPKSELILKR
jgi:hypothetical protein